MKLRLYKSILTFLALCFFGTIAAQKFNKKYTENFQVNKDVTIKIDATNTEITATTWNKNEVQINAFIEVEGLSKKEAEKYINNWNFEALGNKKKVSITSKGSNTNSFEDNFVYFNSRNFNFPEIEVIDFDSLKFPDIPDMPEMNLDFDFDAFVGDFDFDLEKIIENGGEYDFQLKNGIKTIKIKSKKEWEDFKKTKEYKALKNKLLNSKKKVKKEWKSSKKTLNNINKKQLKEELAKAKIIVKNLDKRQIKADLKKATEELKKLNFAFFSDKKESDLMINGKKVIIKKKIEIKIPKGATFDLNIRHCKLKLPNAVASGSVKYGSFNANNLIGGKLTIDYAKVSINDLNACTLFLNNVSEAKIASVTNTTMKNNSSGVQILKINKNVNLTDKFGELTIDSFDVNFGEFVLNLSQSDVTFVLGDVKSSFDYDIKNSKLNNKSFFDFLNKVIKNYDISTKSTVTNNNTKNNLKLIANYSSILIK